MKFLKNEPLNKYTTMRLGGPASFLCRIKNEQDLLEAVTFAKKKRLKIITLGSGSNIIFSDNGFDGLVIINNIKGLKVDKQTGIIKACAGELWDDVVEASVEANLSGIESLSLVPGTVGGAPVNNIGAYGQEIKDTLIEVRAYDTANDKFINIKNKECELVYRNSIFKSKYHGRYVITEITLQLKDGHGYHEPIYASLQSALKSSGVKKPTLADIREAVIAIRKSKLPDPNIIPNTGSFFKNPVVENSKRDELLVRFPDLVYFDYNGKTKLAAGWLIDNASLKGFELDGIKIYDKQALILTNIGSQSSESLNKMVNYIQKKIKEIYGVELQVEPELK